MIETIMANEAQTRRFFRALNRFMLLMWRLGLGPFLQSPYWGYIMVLITTGHKSGLRRLAPVNYDREGDVVTCLPGFGARTHWYRNLMADPHCEVWLPDGWWSGTAEDITDPEERLAVLRRTLIRAGFVTWLVEGLDPARVSDEKLRELGARYDRMIRIRLTGRRTGPGGPGDLAWVWPLILVVWLVLRRLRGRAPRKLTS